MLKKNFPHRKRQKQEEAIERMTLNIQKRDEEISLLKDDPDKKSLVDNIKEHRQRLVDVIENTKKNLR